MNIYFNLGLMLFMFCVSVWIHPAFAGLLILPILAISLKGQPKREKDAEDKYNHER
jgi:hypothetical protein